MSQPISGRRVVRLDDLMRVRPSTTTAELKRKFPAVRDVQPGKAYSFMAPAAQEVTWEIRPGVWAYLFYLPKENQ